MNAYLFIIAVYDAESVEISFDHRVVLAESVDDAYAVGQRAAELAGVIPVKDGEIANDYVIQLVVNPAEEK